MSTSTRWIGTKFGGMKLFHNSCVIFFLTDPATILLLDWQTKQQAPTNHRDFLGVFLDILQLMGSDVVQGVRRYTK